MKFERFLNREAVPEWRPKYLNYHLLKGYLKGIPISQSNKLIENEFFTDARKELRKIDNFYIHKQLNLATKLSLASLSKQNLITLYTETDLLKSFRALNITAVHKIVKKFVKITGSEAEARKLLSEAESSRFWSQPNDLDHISSQIEALFTSKYAGGDRHRAMRRLRLRNFKNESYHSAALLAGILWTSTLAVILYIFTYFYQNTSGNLLFYIYASHFLPFIALGLFSINAVIFKKVFINYIFVFQFDKRTALHECQYASLVGLFAFTFVTTALLVFKYADTESIKPSICLMPLMSVLLVFLNPTPWPWYSARLCIIKTCLKIFSAPFFPVIFKDFFINDHLISQAHFFQGILMAFNFNMNDWSVKAIPIIPNLTRTLQCLRRFMDTKVKLNLLNASKYTLSMIVLVLRSISIPTSKRTWIDVLQALSSLFSLYWDMVMDFGLLQTTRDYRNILLRDQLIVFPYKTFYYYVIVFNCCSRFAWILSNYPFLSKNTMTLLLSTIEIIRRFHWSFLRIEYEHLNNCNSFRAVDDTIKIAEGENGRTADLFYKDMVSESKSDHEDEEIIEENEETVDDYETSIV